jgi:hypothetical protein
MNSIAVRGEYAARPNAVFRVKAIETNRISRYLGGRLAAIIALYRMSSQSRVGSTSSTLESNGAPRWQTSNNLWKNS